MNAILGLAILAISLLACSAQVPCTVGPTETLTMYQFQCGDYRYDITNLKSAGSPPYFCTPTVALGSPPTNYYFCMNVISPGLPGPNQPITVGSNTYNCNVANTTGPGYFTVMQISQVGTSSCWGVGHYPVVTASATNPSTTGATDSQLTLSYINGQGTRSARLVVKCTGATSPVPTFASGSVTEAMSTYTITMTSQTGCGYSSPTTTTVVPNVVECTLTSDTSAICDNVTYSIDELQTITSPTLAYQLDENSVFLFQVANGGLPRVVPVGGQACLLDDAGNAAALFSLASGNCEPLASLGSEEQWTLLDDSVLNILFADSTTNSTVAAIIQCSPSQFAAVLSVEEQSPGDFSIVLQHCSACRDGCA